MASRKNTKEKSATLPSNLSEIKNTLNEKIVRDVDETDEQFAKRKYALEFKKIQAFKDLIMQDVSKNGSNRTFTQYTKALIKQYLQNPYNYLDSIREVSRYLWRVSTIYKRLIMYYATMPTYNYNVTRKFDVGKEFNLDKELKDYANILKKLHGIDFKHEFTQAIALSVRDGIWASFIYDSDDGTFFFYLDPKYIRYRGKNEKGLPVIAFDLDYFSSGSNKIFVEGIEIDGTINTDGCWDDVFVQGWKDYQENKNVYTRWLTLPPEKTMCLLANLDDEFDVPLPLFSGIFISLLDCMDAEQIIADKTALENYMLLVSKIPLLDSDTVDDMAVSIELVQAIQEIINSVIPAQVGSFYTPLDVELLRLGDKVGTDDTDSLTKSIANVYSLAGPAQVIVGGSLATTATALKLSVLNDCSLSYKWLDRLEFEYQYHLEMEVSDKYLFNIHRQNIYFEEDYINKFKDSSSLGNAPMDYLTALGNTPYSAWCKLQFENSIGLRDLMIPLQSSYTSNISDNNKSLTDEGEKTRDQNKNDGESSRK